MSGHDPRPVGEDDLHALVDGRLDTARRVIVEAWLARHPDAAERLSADRAFRDRLRERLGPIASEPVPARLRIANLTVSRSFPVGQWPKLAATIVLAFGVGGAGGWFGRGVTESAGRDIAPMTREAVEAFRTFVVEVVHPVEVRANEKPHLVQWLSRRLDQTLKVPDLAAQGFRLMGGRVVPAGSRPAALLMYDDDAGARLTLYVRDARGDDGRSFRYARDGDVAAFSWTGGDLAYVVTARIDEARLLIVAQAVDGQVLRASAP